MATPTNSRWLELALAGVWAATALSLLTSGNVGALGSQIILVVASSALILSVAGFVNVWFARALVVVILGTSLVAGVRDPQLLVHPLGLLVLNLPVVLSVIVALRLRTRGWDTTSCNILLWGLSFLWIYQGLLPKMIFQHELDLEMVAAFTLGIGNPGSFLFGLGVLEIGLGVLMLFVKGATLKRLLLGEGVLLVGLAISSGWLEPTLWLNPHAPFPKTLLVAVMSFGLAMSPLLRNPSQGAK